MEQKDLIKRFSILLILLNSIFLVLSYSFALSYNIEISHKYKSENISKGSFTVMMRDGALISGVYYVPPEKRSYNNNSVPTILLLNGINSRKEDNFIVAYQFLKKGYAVFSVEQRGHGESFGLSGFLSKEPFDMIEVINFIQEEYNFVNYSHISVIGFSYGGGIGTILQAIDERIYSSVLFYPLTSLEGLFERLPFQNLVGKTFVIDDLNTIKDAFYYANASNSHNILLIQGLDDTLILPEKTQVFFEYVNGSQKEDIQLKFRPNMGHQFDDKSLKYAIAWINSFYIDNTINISNLDAEIESISLVQPNLSDPYLSEIFLIISSILLFLSIEIYLFNSKIIPKWKERPFLPEGKKIEKDLMRYKKMIIKRTMVYFIPLFLIGPIFSFFNRSLIYGYFLAYPIITSLILLFLPSELHKNWKIEWDRWKKYSSKPFIYSLIGILLATLFFLIFFNINALIMSKPIIPIINSSIVTYIFLTFSTLIMDYLYLRDFEIKHTILLPIIKPFSILLFLLFIPLPPFPLLGGLITHILFITLTGVVILILYYLTNLLSKIFKNTGSLFILVMLPFLILFIYIFFRIV
jgi:dienelactone hydrolase